MPCNFIDVKEYSLNQLKILRSGVKKIQKFIGPHAGMWMVLGVAGTLILSVVELSIAYFIPLFFKSLGLMDISIGTESPLQKFNLSVWGISVGLVILGIVRFVGQYLVNQSGHTAQESISVRLRKVLIYRILLHPNQKFQSASVSNYFLGTIFPAACLGIQLASIASGLVLQSFFLVVIMFTISWKEAIIGVIGLGIVGFVVRKINKNIKIRSAIIPKESKQLIVGFERVAKNWLLVKVLRTQKIEHKSFTINIDKIYFNSIKAASLGNIAGSGTPLLGIIFITLIVLVSKSYWNTPGSVLLSFLYVFIRFTQGLSTTVNSLTQIARYLPQLREGMRFFFEISHDERMLALGERPIFDSIESEKIDIRKVVSSIPPKILFSNVAFAYENSNVISDLSFELVSGSTLGIIGSSGSGKTTLLMLLIGALKPDSGMINIDRNTASEMLLDGKLNIGYVGPEAFLFEGTIRENLEYGLAHVTEEQIWEALSSSKLYDVIKTLPNRLSHRISENGEGLSAGQKQRLCLARIFLRKPSLIILDEATANLDARTEEEVVKSLSSLKGRATTIIVTHRPSTLVYADCIYNMETKTFIKS